jgi:DNA-directed RNA polymerase sigma subunit (sigma70/sigma32)
MKHDSLRKLERNKLLREYKDTNPGLSFREVGEVFGISKQRAHQIYQIELKKQK